MYSSLWKRVIAWERNRAASAYGIIWGGKQVKTLRDLVRNVMAWIVVVTVRFNPLTPVPAVTGHVKTHPQFPVPAATGREKPCQDICLSYPPWRVFGPPIVLLLRTNIPMTMDFLSIFLGDFRGPRKTVFVFKSRARKVQVIMVRSGTNLQTSRVLFSFLKRTNYFSGT